MAIGIAEVLGFFIVGITGGLGYLAKFMLENDDRIEKNTVAVEKLVSRLFGSERRGGFVFDTRDRLDDIEENLDEVRMMAHDNGRDLENLVELIESKYDVTLQASDGDDDESCSDE